MVHAFVRTAAIVLLLLVPSTASAAVRYATPGGSTASVACPASDPCRLDRAVNAAAANDEVVIGPGTYRITVPLRPVAALDLHGDPDHAWPRVIGDTAM